MRFVIALLVFERAWYSGMMLGKWRIAIILAAVLVAGAVIWAAGRSQIFFSATGQDDARFAVRVPQDDRLPLASGTAKPQNDIEVVADKLQIPWAIAWLPDGQILVTERPGRLLKISSDRSVIPIDGVAHVGEGGLMGVAVHPQFTSNQWIYLYLTTRAGDGLVNRVERYRLVGNQLRDKQVILDKLPGARFHDGGRLAFGPDGLLYVTVGDATDDEEAQNPASLNGTILRVNDDGSVPSDNPLGTAVYSYGHRNSQGLAWDDRGRLWATEHGRSGLQSGLDEINVIEAGKNYGWPLIEGDERAAGMESPVFQSGPDVTWAPAGAAWYDGSIFFAGLRGGSRCMRLNLSVRR